MYEQKIIDFMSHFAGKTLHPWTLSRRVANQEMGYCRGCGIPKERREALSKVIQKEVGELIRRNVLIRYCYPKPGRPAGVRLNEAYVNSVLHRRIATT